MKDFRNLEPLEYLKILWRRKWYALACFILVGAGAAAYSWRTPNVYKSEARILVENGLISQDYVRSDHTSPEEQIAAIRVQIQSRSFLERMVTEFGLFGYGNDKNFSMDYAVTGIGRNIQVVSTAGNVFSISYAAPEAQQAQQILRRIVETLITTGNSSRKSRAVEADQFLDEQLRQTQQNLAEQEDKIKKFKMEHLGELPEQAATNMNALSGARAQLAAVESALQRARDLLKLLDMRNQEQKRLSTLTRDLIAPPPSAPAKAARNVVPPNPLISAKQIELNNALVKYTASHPDVIRLKRELEELKRIEEARAAADTPISTDDNAAVAKPERVITGAESMLDVEAAELRMENESIRNEIAKREKEKEGILAEIKTYQGKLNLAPALDQMFTALSRDYEALKQQYANLQSKKFQSQMTANLENSKNSDTYRVMDEPNMPEKPSFPNRIQIIWMGIGVGFAAGIGAAFGRELLDSTLSNEDEVSFALKLPVLVTISEIPAVKAGRAMKLIGKGKPA